MHGTDRTVGAESALSRAPLSRAPVPSTELMHLLDRWLPTQRWYPVKGLRVHHVPWLSYDLPVGKNRADGVVSARLHQLRIVSDRAEDGVDLVVQVPVIEAVGDTQGPDTQRPGLIGHLTAPDGSSVTVHDGATHPVLWAALLDALEWAPWAPAALKPGSAEHDLLGAHVISGEQSNSSVILPAVAGGTILKILRTIAIGPNPDVVIPGALAGGGWTGVPRPVGWLEAGWAASDVPADAPALGPDRMAHLAVVSELVADAQDGFELACAAAGQDASFADLASDLGVLVAQLHAALRAVLPTGPRLDVDWLMTDLRRRAVDACDAVAPLARNAPAILAFLDSLEARLREESAALPRLQSIHGDLHLGQVLHSPDGWKVIDFEGEPLRPVAERTRPDLALRDVAGIVRSFDYAAAVGGATDPVWAVHARAAFIDAYRRTSASAGGASSEPEHLSDGAVSALLRALVLDKALYEVVYESRNRPDWAWIPLAAVERILAGLT